MSRTEKAQLLGVVHGIALALKDLQGEGQGQWMKGEDPIAVAKSGPSSKEASPASQGRFVTTPELAAHTDLPHLHGAIQDCVRCPLGKVRKKFVFGEGNPHARLMFIGEAPGRDEDLQGRPFVGRAGQLLTKIIEAMGLKREDVYIANLLKCRPPNNRPPQPEEIEKCWPHLSAQIGLIKPKVICVLGSYAARTLLAMDLPIGSLRGHFYEIDGIPIMATYHPAYLLRNPNDKRKVWEDMKKVRDSLKTIPS